MNSNGPLMRFYALPIIGILIMAILKVAQGQMMVPSPAPLPPSNDGAAIDQGIAYFLLLLALAVTYLFH
ncbi:hypothetical protein BVRB_8g196160 [Beta vulgaris subsp. vulgaris]|nr:hypothetical protein BVRB_8g196160 [Beta vulgaris subsp. vulgaris]